MTPAAPSPEDLIHDVFYALLKQYVIEVTGLAYYVDKDSDFARRLSNRMAALQISDCSFYLALLRDPTRGARELEALIREITIGETQFFRHREHFDALRRIVLPELAAVNRASRTLRIWSAGCADGAEPYSISILIRHEMSASLGGWYTHIVGTDINQQSLKMAREGAYEEWSFRSTPDELRQACFQKDGKRWRIDPEYRKGVLFQQHNLAETDPPNGFGIFDLIVCRNVMIYFAPELMQRLVRCFHDSLMPGGYLLVGPSEPNMTAFTSFHAVNAPGVTLYRKPAEPAKALSLERHSFPLLPWQTPVRDSLLNPPPSLRASVDTLEDVRRASDRGDWDVALQCCKKLLRRDNLDPQIHLHCALVHEQLGKATEAEKSLRNALYLDRKSVLAHYYLGLLRKSRGDKRQSVRAFENAMELLLLREDSEILAGVEEFTVEDLRRLVQLQIDSLRSRE